MEYSYEYTPENSRHYKFPADHDATQKILPAQGFERIQAENLAREVERERTVNLQGEKGKGEKRGFWGWGKGKGKKRGDGES